MNTENEVIPEKVKVMALDYCCPYYLYEGPLCVFCEGGKMRFRDFPHRRDYIYAYCAAVPGWEGCTVAQGITKSYERSDAHAREKARKKRAGKRAREMAKKGL
ncbi:MAG TPA: hypothetical protein VN446_06870 [Candidatus Acidoferrum sp.]|nr:hypothetical protein [Candidatus Acidoferrum sp.]